MFVITETAGLSRRNEPSLSSASATRNWPCPRRALDPIAWSLPPTTIVGSSPPRASTAAIIEVVVVLPCEPPTATPYFMRISSASISARPITGIAVARAVVSSGFSGPTALEYTTTCAPSTLAGAWPWNTRPPSRTRRSVISESLRSLPMKWMRCVRPYTQAPPPLRAINAPRPSGPLRPRPRPPRAPPCGRPPSGRGSSRCERLRQAGRMCARSPTCGTASGGRRADARSPSPGARR